MKQSIYENEQFKFYIQPHFAGKDHVIEVVITDRRDKFLRKNAYKPDTPVFNEDHLIDLQCCINCLILDEVDNPLQKGISMPAKSDLQYLSGKMPFEA